MTSSKNENYIYSYYQKINDGSLVVGKWVHAIYKRIVDGIEGGLFSYDAKKANRAINFIETFCHHSKGRSDVIKLELWQKALIACMFGIIDKNGFRQFREVFVVVSRKNGKSLLASAIAAYCMYADGEYGAEIYCVAPKLDQANIVYNAIWQTIEKEPELKAMCKRRKSDYYIAATNTTAMKISFDYKTSDGFNPHLSLLDEVAAWAGDNGLKQYEVMASAEGSRDQPIILAITTAGYENDSIYDELFKRSTRFLLGDSSESRLLPFLYTIDDPRLWNDITELQKSNPNLGVSVKVDFLLEEIAKAEGSLSKKSEFLTKYCCLKANSSQAWLSAQDIEKCIGKPMALQDFCNSYAVVGVDLSRTTDLTACVCVIEKNGILNVFAKFFLPASKLEEATARDNLPYSIYIQRGFLQLSGENFVDYRDCYEWINNLIGDYKIYPLKVGYDKYCATYLVQDLEQTGFNCDWVYQGFNLTPVIHELEGLIKDGKVNIGDNDLLKVHLFDSALKVDAETDKVKLIKLNKNAHVDGCAALLDAVCVRQKFHDEVGEQLQNK